jgi:hypothetical protein
MFGVPIKLYFSKMLNAIAPTFYSHTKEELEFFEEAAFCDSHPDDYIFMTTKEYEDLMASEIAIEMASKTSI